MRRVLRLRPGDLVTLLDGQGSAYEALLVALDEHGAKFRIVRQWEATGEPFVHITLYQAVLKGERFAWALQKGTEIGVSRFTPVVCERNVVDDMQAVDGKRERWERIIQEAAEQSGRAKLPELTRAHLFADAIQAPAGAVLRLIAWEDEHSVRLGEALRACNLTGRTGIQVFVGPEGGLTAAEIDFARRRGVQPVSLGPRTLRAETAGLVAASAILFHAGDF
jgi:16S rRNA (uracil1498-N3)-methyltransferase